jgi:hypothetical protein
VWLALACLQYVLTSGTDGCVRLWRDMFLFPSYLSPTHPEFHLNDTQSNPVTTTLVYTTFRI